jgi:ribose transport system ATP-binding protein
VAELSQVNRCLLAIVRALDEVESSQAAHGGQGILVLDEPTPFLPRAGVEQLFDLIGQVREAGASVIFVSHDIGEIMEITDRATVLRDGQVAGTIDTGRASHDEFVELIIGRRVEAYHLEHKPIADRHIEVEVTGLTGGIVRDVNFSTHKGEVIGLAGLIGTGFDEVPAMLFGAVKAEAGSLVVGDVDFDLRTMEPARAIASGIAYLPADRLAASGAGSLSVADNMTLPSLRQFQTGGYLNRQAMAGWAAEVATRHDVRPNAPGLPLAALSGGNQQKALLAKWLETGPRLLLLDEPTQGVDVGARQQVYEAVGRAVDQGSTVICASTDYEQLAQICDRVLIFARGAIVSDLSGTAITKDAIAQACYAGMAQAGTNRQVAV